MKTVCIVHEESVDEDRDVFYVCQACMPKALWMFWGLEAHSKSGQLTADERAAHQILKVLLPGSRVVA
jgi:hypothetical protein